jgi:hypothetical protein
MVLSAQAEIYGGGRSLECPIMMQLTAPATGIVFCQSAVALEQQRESAYG